jgi:hypothetical protein
MARSHDFRERTATDMHDPQTQARTMVLDVVNGYLNEADKITIDDVYIVWYSYVLSNWKALVSTTIPDDRYYEVTHKAGSETFVDVYAKVSQQIIQADDPVHNL